MTTMDQMQAESHIGVKHNRLTIIGVPFRVRNNSGAVWFVTCECDCGSTLAVRLRNIRPNGQLSCGCVLKDELKTRVSDKNQLFRHGMHNTRLYKVWKGMVSRCTLPKASGWRRYGMRGIRVCQEWRVFLPFYEWSMANGYEDGLQIDRIDNDGDYCPDNCRWSDRKSQCRNKSTNNVVEAFGETKCLCDWELDQRAGYGVTGSMIGARIRNGWDVESAITTPKTK